MDWISMLKVFSAAVAAVIPTAKQRLAERKAGVSPESVPTFFIDGYMDDALRRLGSIQSSDPWFKTAIAGIEAAVLRPETFCKPAVREWLSLSPVRADLKAAAKAKLSQHDIPIAIFERLVDSYTSIETTGEHRSYAENSIYIAVAYLQNSVYGSVRDPGGVAVTQANNFHIFEKLQEEIKILKNTAIFVSNPHLILKLTDEARRDLSKILRRRASPSQDTVGDLKKLLTDFDDGHRLAAADRAVKQEARYWLARIEAGIGNPEVAEDMLNQLVSEGFNVPDAAWGLVELGKEQPTLALRRLRDFRDMDSQTAMFHIQLKTDGAIVALAFVDKIKPSDSTAFTPMGWNNICVTLISLGRVNDAVVYLKMLSPDVLRQCTHLYYLYAVSCLLPMVPRDRFNSVIQEGFSSVVDHLLDSPEAVHARETALHATREALACAHEAEDHLIAERCEHGISILRLRDPLTRAEEEAAIRIQMTDVAAAVKIIWLVRANNIAFDSEPMERYLAHCKRNGGLTSDQLRAEYYLLDHSERIGEFGRFLEDQWNSLLHDNDLERLTVKRVETYAALGDIDAATAFLETQRSSINTAIASRLNLMLRKAKGEDASYAALALYTESSLIDDLWNLVNVLRDMKHWKRLKPFSEELFRREPNFETAMLLLNCLHRARASAAVVNSFLKSTVSLVQQKPQIRSARAWALHDAGDHLAAKQLNDELMSERSDGVDIALDMNIAIRTGDWERFPIISAKAFSIRSQLHSQMLLSLAKLVGFTDPTQAVALAQEAVERDGNDPAVLIGAHMVAIAARRDEIAMPWMHKAARLSKDKDDGLIRTYSHKDLVEFMRSNAESWKYKNEMYRTGQVPIHMATSMFNEPLMQMLVGVPRRNSSEVDVRRRKPTPIRSGKRRPIPADGFSRIALDITTLIILNELGRLKDVIKSYSNIFISPRVMEVMLSDREKVAFHQPSRIAEVRPLIALLTAGHIKVVRSTGDTAILNEVGDEIASLLKAARDQGGQFVHPGVIFKTSSFMEENADIGNLSSLVIDPIDVAYALKQASCITKTMCDEGVDYLQRTGSIARNAVTDGSPLFIDSLAFQYLHQAKLLQPLINSEHVISVHQSTVDEWQALLATEPKTEDLKAALDEIRLVLREGLLSAKIQFLTQSRRHHGLLNGISLLPVMDFFEDISSVEAAVIDDRMFSDKLWLTDSNDVTVPLLSSLDLLDTLIARNTISTETYHDALHTLRASCFFCIPLTPAELLFHLETSDVISESLRETAELRVIREYLARLHSTDVLCTPSDFEYLDSIWNCGIFVIAKLWANQTTPIIETIVKANWVIMNIIPNIELAMRFTPDGYDRISQVAAGQAEANLLGININVERRHAQAKWFEDSCLTVYLPANFDVLDKIAAQAADALVHRTQEVTLELERKNSPATT
jgi:tetratricopeptide (TPR) repeat protein